jgi:hypothetical protein
MLPEEREAVRMLWGRDDQIPSDEHARLLAEVRARRAAIEQEALEMLYSKLREGRRTPRRHMVFAFAVLAIGMAVSYVWILIATR